MAYISDALKDIVRGFSLVADGSIKIVGPPVFIIGTILFWLLTLVGTGFAYSFAFWLFLESYHYKLWTWILVDILSIFLIVKNRDLLTFFSLFVICLIAEKDFWLLSIAAAGVGSLFPMFLRSLFGVIRVALKPHRLHPEPRQSELGRPHDDLCPCRLGCR